MTKEKHIDVPILLSMSSLHALNNVYIAYTAQRITKDSNKCPSQECFFWGKNATLNIPYNFGSMINTVKVQIAAASPNAPFGSRSCEFDVIPLLTL